MAEEPHPACARGHRGHLRGPDGRNDDGRGAERHPSAVHHRRVHAAVGDHWLSAFHDLGHSRHRVGHEPIRRPPVVAGLPRAVRGRLPRLRPSALSDRPDCHSRRPRPRRRNAHPPGASATGPNCWPGPARAPDGRHRTARHGRRRFRTRDRRCDRHQSGMAMDFLDQPARRPTRYSRLTAIHATDHCFERPAPTGPPRPGPTAARARAVRLRTLPGRAAKAPSPRRV